MTATSSATGSPAVAADRGRSGAGGRPWIEGLAMVGLATLLYTALFARYFFQSDTVMGGDTQVLWSLNHLALYALKVHGTFLWWDPSALGGWPAYVNLTIGWFNYLGPYALAWLAPFTVLGPLLDLPVNAVLVFQKTVYCFALNATAAWLLSREILRSRAARVFVLLGFTLGAMPFQGFRDSVLWEGMAPTLFLFWALVRLVERRDPASLRLAYLFAVLCAASLSYATLQVAVWWFFSALVLILLCFPAFTASLPGLHRQLWRSPLGGVFLPTAVLALVAGLLAVALPALFHLGELLRVLGFGTVDWDTGAGGNFGDLMVHHQGWSILLTWMPFSDVYDTLLGLKGALGNLNRSGIDQRYLGIATLPLLLVALFRRERLRWLGVLGLTWFVCAVFVPYTRENQAIVALMDSTDVLRNIRTIANTLPRDVPSLFLLIAAGLGVDALLRCRRHPADPWLRWILVLMAAGALALLGASAVPRLADFRHSLGHIGIFLTVISLLVLVLTFAAGREARRTLAVGLLVVVACDLTISASSYWQRGLVWFRNEGPHRLPQLDLLRPVDSSLQTWAGSYGGVIHNGYVGPILGIRSWLVLESRPDLQHLLPNWNPDARTMNRYPDASLVRDTAEVPFEAIRKIDSVTLPAAPLLLHAPPAADLPHKASPLPGDAVTVSRFAPNFVALDVEAAEPAYLLLRDNYDDFWSARLNGHAVPIERVNFTQKALLVPAGRSEVVLEYDPWPARLVWWVYYFLLAASVLLALVPGAGGRRRVALCFGLAAAIALAGYGVTVLVSASRADAARMAATPGPVAGIRGQTLYLPDGRELAVRPGTIGGLERVHRDPYGLSDVRGWVIEPQSGQAADGVHLFVGDRYWVSARPDRMRADISDAVPAGFAVAARGADSKMIDNVRAFASFPGGYVHEIGGEALRTVDPPIEPKLPGR